jgi:Tfp pilus assembly protein PilF
MPQLTDAVSGAALWAQPYDRERHDIFAIQSEIALEVARALSVELSLAERERMEHPPTANPQALDYYLNAKHWLDRMSFEEMRLATTDVEQAITLDPNFTDAWVLSSEIHTNAQFLDPEHIDEHRAAARRSAERALELDPELAAAHTALAKSLIATKDWAGAESAFADAMRLRPSFEVGANRAFLRMSAGKFEASERDAFEKVREADHAAEVPHRFLAFVHAQMGDWDRANAVSESALRLFANDDRAVRALQEQRIHWLVGRGNLAEAKATTIRDAFNAQMVAMLDAPTAEALAELRRASDASTDGNPNHRRDIALWAGHFGDPQLALTTMREVVNAQAMQMTYVWMPQLAPMRGLPEFKAWMTEIGMVAYWEKYGWPRFCQPVHQHDFECH